MDLLSFSSWMTTLILILLSTSLYLIFAYYRRNDKPLALKHGQPQYKMRNSSLSSQKPTNDHNSQDSHIPNSKLPVLDSVEERLLMNSKLIIDLQRRLNLSTQQVPDPLLEEVDYWRTRAEKKEKDFAQARVDLSIAQNKIDSILRQCKADERERISRADQHRQEIDSLRNALTANLEERNMWEDRYEYVSEQHLNLENETSELQKKYDLLLQNKKRQDAVVQKLESLVRGHEEQCREYEDSIHERVQQNIFLNQKLKDAEEHIKNMRLSLEEQEDVFERAVWLIKEEERKAKHEEYQRELKENDDRESFQDNDADVDTTDIGSAQHPDPSAIQSNVSTTQSHHFVKENPTLKAQNAYKLENVRSWIQQTAVGMPSQMQDYAIEKEEELEPELKPEQDPEPELEQEEQEDEEDEEEQEPEEEEEEHGVEHEEYGEVVISQPSIQDKSERENYSEYQNQVHEEQKEREVEGYKNEEEEIERDDEKAIDDIVKQNELRIQAQLLEYEQVQEHRHEHEYYHRDGYDHEDNQEQEQEQDREIEQEVPETEPEQESSDYKRHDTQEVDENNVYSEDQEYVYSYREDDVGGTTEDIQQREEQEDFEMAEEHKELINRMRKTSRIPIKTSSSASTSTSLLPRPTFLTRGSSQRILQPSISLPLPHSISGREEKDEASKKMGRLFEERQGVIDRKNERKNLVQRNNRGRPLGGYFDKKTFSKMESERQSKELTDRMYNNRENRFNVVRS
ncbi:hypothetical protein J3Q64DRAFT_1759619 [Phycomyces blakesleeanus]|uniref:Uncharacterized protein n=1 Tax=Phycomyces blakesleeanus TaxID=4837 RepID=A0ABR3ARV7_PHYBL